MTDLRTAAQRALEALEFLSLDFFMLDPISPGREASNKAITALRAALAEPVQEPVAWHYTNNAGASVMHWGPSNRLDADMRAAKDYPHVHKVTPLYTAPPQRKPLTEVDLRALYDGHAAYQEEGPEASGWWGFARAIERAHEIGGEE